MKEYLIKFYLEFWNDFLTAEKYAEYYGITKQECIDLLKMGKKYHNEKCVA